MHSNYQQTLLDDLNARESYGMPLIGWRGQVCFYKAATVPLSPDNLGGLAKTFVEETYFLLRTRRVVRPTQGLHAPFGMDHPSFIRGLVSQRKPGKPDGWWWSPARPRKSIDNVSRTCIALKIATILQYFWNGTGWITTWKQIFPLGTLVYVGRAAPQQESALYGKKKYGGGGFQFRLTAPREQTLRSMKRYISA